MGQFVALDIETADKSGWSIIQIGLVVFEDGAVVEKWETLVNPGVAVIPEFVEIHGIEDAELAEAPSLGEILPQLAKRLEGQVVASHTRFDRDVFLAALSHKGLPVPACTWLDSREIAVVAWPELCGVGYRLNQISAHLSIPLNHHDALSDAHACGRIVLEARARTGRSVQAWVRDFGQPVSARGFPE